MAHRHRSDGPDAPGDRRVPGAQAPRTRYWSARLFWESCRRHVDVPAIRAALAEGADTEVNLAAAVRHRTGPLLWRALRAAGATGELAEQRASLEAIATVHRLEALLLVPRALALAVDPLTAAGLQPVVLKGPAVAARYPAPGLRPMDDIDLLLPLPQHERAIAALRDAGWQVVREARRDLYDTALAHPDLPTLPLELHYGLERPYYRVTSLDATALWERRQPIDCLGVAAFGLPLPEELVVLAAHAGKPHHDFCRLVWIADLVMLVGDGLEHDGSVEWDRVRSVADAGGCTTTVSAAMALAGHAGLDVPPGLFPPVSRLRRAEGLGQVLDVTWPMATAWPPSVRLHLALTDGWRRLRIAAALSGSGYGVGRCLRQLTGAQSR